MARKLSEPSGSLFDGAQRLERVILTVKARQLAETHNAPVLKPTSDAFSFSPDEIWSKNYMTVGIGPSVRQPQAGPRETGAFTLPEQPRGGKKLQPPLAHAPALNMQPVTIGQVLAKPARRRSWLGRIFRGS